MRQVLSRDETPADQAAPDPAASGPDRHRLYVGALVAVLVAPLVIAAIALHQPQWYPVLDLAMTELRLRDVFTSHTPLIGLPGRIGRFPEQGSHPGPMSFYALWPAWKVLGSSSWGMQVGALLLNAMAAATSVLIAFRRGGLRLAVAVTALLALLMSGYGISTLAEPWNPYIPLMWWVVTLLAVWSVLCGDVKLLPVAVVSASMAAQTHVPYLGLSLGMGAVALGGLAWKWRRGDDHREILRWGAVALALAALLWSPLLVDQATKHPGNLSMLWDHFTSPPGEEGTPVGTGRGIELQLQHLDITTFVRGQGGSLGSLARSSGDVGGSVLPGIVVLGAWVAAAVVAWRRHLSDLNRLNVVIGAGLVLGVFSMSRIFGKVWYYLMLWSWGTVALLVLSVGWTAVAVFGRERLSRAGIAALVAIGVLSSGLLAAHAATVDPPAPQLSAVLAGLVDPAADALDHGAKYLVTWDDSFYIGSQGYGLVSELERLGFRVGVPDTWRVPVTQHRVFRPDQVDAEVHLAVGGFVERWREVAQTNADVRELAFAEPRTRSEIAEYDSLRKAVIDDLYAAHLDTEVDLVDGNLFGLSLDDRLPDGTRERVEHMLELGSPGAVFLMPTATILPAG